MKINRTNQIMKISIGSDSESKKEAIDTLTYYIQDVVENVIDQAVYTNSDGDTIQFYGQDDTYFVEYINTNPLDETFIGDNLISDSMQNELETVEFFSGSNKFCMKKQVLLSYKDVIDILRIFITSYDKHSFLEYIFNEYSITNTKYYERLKNGKMKFY